MIDDTVAGPTSSMASHCCAKSIDITLPASGATVGPHRMVIEFYGARQEPPRSLPSTLLHVASFVLLCPVNHECDGTITRLDIDDLIAGHEEPVSLQLRYALKHKRRKLMQLH